MSADLPPVEAPVQGEQTNQLRFILDVVARHRMLVFAPMLFGALAGVAMGFWLNDERYQFEAYADLVVSQSPWDRPVMRDMGSGLFEAVTPQALKEHSSMRALAEDIARALVQEDVAAGSAWSNVSSEEEYAQRASAIQGVLTLDDFNEAGFLRLRAQSNDRAEAIRFAEIGARVLIEHTRRTQQDEQEEAFELVHGQLADLSLRLDAADSARWKYREAMGFRTHDQVLVEMEKKDSELREAITTREEIGERLLEIDAALIKNKEDLPASLGNVSEGTVEKLIAELELLIGEKAELMVDWLPGSPGLIEIEDEIQAKREAVQISIQELNAGQGGGSSFWEQRKLLYRDKVNLELQTNEFDIRVETLRRLLIDMVDELPELADKSFALAALVHEAQQIRNRYDLMLTKEFEIRTDLERGTATVERRDAVVVGPPTFTGTQSPLWASLAIGAIIGFFCGFALAIMWEMNDTSIRGVEDVNQYLGLEVIGMIPMMKFGKPSNRARRRRGVYIVASGDREVDDSIVTHYDPKSPISEAYRSLRTNYQFATIREAPKSVMITSAVPGEGKTTTATNFAVTMADRGMRVLIVDTDLRRPNVHRVLKMERGPGLADVLRERIPVKNVIRSTQVENLWMISSGRVPPNPSELIGSDRMKRLMNELSQTFDLVVCDAPSILVVTDPVLLATHVETVALVVSVNNARRETIQRAKKLMETANPFIAGVVLNGLEATRRHYYYYYYYYDDVSLTGRRRWYQNI